MLKKFNKRKDKRWPAYEKRLIKQGGGRKKSLNHREEIILTLYYLHHMPTLKLLGIIFGVSESTANNICKHSAEC
ncbi:transposase family protein [Okeania sp. SIO2C9]|uniref:helix-turn-helix domain-containing protein n=1 Tax=Okeania sp. SIO2C9 TaxID=2607791 RepID=UPI00345C68A9